MEQYDEKTAQRVWQRVRGTGTPPMPPLTNTTPSLAGIVQEQRQCAQLCQRLAGAVAKEDAARLRSLSRQWTDQADCLTGIARLQGKQPPAPLRPGKDQEPAEALLRRCIGTSLRNALRLEALSTDTEYGPLYKTLAAQEHHRSIQLLTILSHI